MRTGTLAFLAGIVLFCYQTELPALSWLPVAALPLLLYPFLYPGLRRQLYLPACLSAGFLWAWLYGLVSLGQGLAPELEGVDVSLLGRVASLPEHTSQSVRFELAVEELEVAGRLQPAPRRVRLSWYRPTPGIRLPRVGERWRFVVRLKAPRGFRNPGGFDYEAWLFHHGIRATGYVRGQQGELLGEAGTHFLLSQVRQALRDRLQAVTDGHPMGAIIVALGLGERSGISAQQWAVLRRTGTSHLVAISGLHVGLVAGLVFGLTRRLARLSGGFLAWAPAPRVAAVLAVLAAIAYAALAGFAIPTQRALVMVAVVMLAVWRQQPMVLADTLLLALLAVLVYDPFSVLAAGFWLSFGAVAVIGYVLSGRLKRRSWLRQGLTVQMGVGVGLLPFLLGLFGRASVVSPLANIVAVPFVGLLVVPLTLLGLLLMVFSTQASGLVFQITLGLLDVIWPGLEWLAGRELAEFDAVEPPLWTVAGAMVASGLLLAPRGVPGRWLGAVLMLPLLFAQPVRPTYGGFWFSLLDVGQGLASVIITSNHVLVYDTGARFSEEFDAGSAVVLPYLRAKGVGLVDRLVISHLDNDHAGGVSPLVEQIPISNVLSSESSQEFHPRQQLCQLGQKWVWDGVRFEMLFPDSVTHNQRGRNDRSCVLKVSNAKHSVLLTGDIEALSEYRLVSLYGEKLNADVLIAPHHGSKTSSTARFIDTVKPRYVLFPIGYRNRYRFPATRVLTRYNASGAQLFDTAQHGAIEFRLPELGPLSFALYRPQTQRFWSAP
jgi:competence protein ComEC